jgi:AcrR family transcriptional regulator
VAATPPYTDSVWLRPPRAKGGQQPGLSREQIVRAAIEILDAEDIAGLSMRRLGTKLGAGATSLYWYVAHKDELLELAVDEVMGEVYVPEVGDTPWRIGASLLCNGFRQMLVHHPWVLRLLGTHPTLGPNSMRIGDRTVALLVDAGFQGLDVSHASALLMSHAIGSATTMSAATSVTKNTGQPIGELVEVLRPHVDRAATDHPAYDKWWREMSSKVDPETMLEEGFRFGLERLLDGLDLWLKSNNPT